MSAHESGTAKNHFTFQNLAGLAKSEQYREKKFVSELRRGSLPPPMIGKTDNASRNQTQQLPDLFRRETSFSGSLNGKV